MAQDPYKAEFFSTAGIKMMVMPKDFPDDLVGAAA